MQDKLIEAAQDLLYDLDHGIGTMESINALKEAIAAVRAHDAPEMQPWWEKEWAESFNKYHAYAHKYGCVPGGDVLDFVLQDALAYRAPHAAESTAQLDAEDPAEPVEDVVSRMCELMGGCACEHCIKRMTTALAIAREGYYSQQDVEKAIRTAWARDWCGIVTPESFEQFLALIMARLAPKPSPDPIEEVIATAICNECGARVGKRELHLKWHAALFPKTGGVK